MKKYDFDRSLARLVNNLKCTDWVQLLILVGWQLDRNSVRSVAGEDWGGREYHGRDGCSAGAVQHAPGGQPPESCDTAPGRKACRSIAGAHLALPHRILPHSSPRPCKKMSHSGKQHRSLCPSHQTDAITAQLQSPLLMLRSLLLE